MDSNLAAYAAYEAEKRRQAEQQQQNQPNLIDALGKLALGTGAAVASYYGIRGLTQRLKTADPFSVGSYAPKPSQVPVDEAAVRRAAGAVPTEVARQQRGIELTRLARAERPQGVRQGNLKDLIESVNVQDLGPAYVPVNPERAKIDLSFINNVLIPMEQKRLPSATDFLQQRLTGQKTDLPVARTPGTFREFSQEASLPGITAANKLAEDADLLREVERQNLENLSEARSFQSKAQAEYRRLLSATVQEEVFDVLKKEANTVQAAAQSDFGPQKFIQDAGYVEADSLVDQHRSNLIGQVDHFANAANSAEDQATGRVKRALQRNEDENLAAVEMAEDAVDTQIARAAQSDSTVASVTELDAAINQVADGLPDGRPVDQAEAVATQPKYVFRERVFEKPGASLQEQAAKTQRYRTATPVSIISARSGGREARVGEMGRPGRFTVLPPGTTTEGMVFTGPSTPTLNADEIAAKLSEMQVSKEAQIQNAMARGLSEARAKRNVQMTESQRAALESSLPSYSSEDVLSRAQVKSYGDINEAERFLEEATSRSGQLRALEEGGFLTEQQDPGTIRTEPQQVRRGTMIKPASKTSYRGVTGRPGVGIYGEQAPGRPGTPGFGAGAVEASKVIKTEGEERAITTPRKFIPGVDDPATQTPEGFVYTEEAMTQPTQARGGYRRYGTQTPTRSEAAQEAFDVSRQLRLLQQSGRPEDAQAFLDKIMQERGISALGQSQPLRQQMNRGKFQV